MSYSDFGLDEKKISVEEGKIEDFRLCLWGEGGDMVGHFVHSGFSLCFSNFIICRECADNATRIENQERWLVGECTKCFGKNKISYSSKKDNPEWGMYICKDCIDWAKETFRNKDKQQPRFKTTHMETIEILLKCTVVGNTVKLPNIQLDHVTEYAPVKKQLERIGGKWNTRASCFIFEEDPTELLADLQSGKKRDIKKEFQFFATPTPLANYLVSIAYEEHLKNVENPTILEPSAGDGSLVKAIVKHFQNQRVDCFELMEANRIKLQQVSGADILGNDFLEAVEVDTMKMITDNYDLVIANPPFSKTQDIDHVKAMYRCVKPGGLIVTICSPSLQFGQTKKQVDFREWLAELNADQEEIPTGHFKESGTQAGGFILTIRKPVDNNAIFNNPKEEVNPEKTQTEEPQPEMQAEPDVSFDENLEQIAAGLKKANGHINEMKTYLNPPEMEFFKQISELIGQSDISFVLKAKGDNLTVMITRGATASSKPIPPLTLTGTPEELDEGFFSEVSATLSRMTGLTSNAKEVEKALDETEGSSAVSGMSATGEAAPPKKTRAKRQSAATPSPSDGTGSDSPDEWQDNNGTGEEVQTVSLSAEELEEQERIRLEEEQKSQEAQRLKMEEEEAQRKKDEEEKAAAERQEKYDAFIMQSYEHELASDYREAARSLKAAKEFTTEPDVLNDKIRELLTKAAEKEMDDL